MNKVDRRFITNFDWMTLGLVLFLSVTGISTIYSATRPLMEGEHPSFFVKQLYWLITGIVAMAVVVSVDYVWLRRVSFVLYAVGLLLLLFVLVAGKVGLGAQRWINLGPIGFQPSEFFKLTFLIMLARYMSALRGSLGIGGVVMTFSLFAFLPFLMLLKQPDLGTAVVMLLVFVAMVFGKGVQKRAIVLAVTISLVSVPFMGGIFWNELKEYQRKRLVAFVNPEIDPGGTSYHVTQSKVAIGSGGLIGKGYLKGTQGPLRFLPEKHTDFIFAVFAEEWGLLGSTIILIAYMMLILRGLDTARKAKDEFGRLLSLGITSMFAIYFLINVGMTMGLMPVVGIPLPFMSYGGTAILSNFIAAGVLINIRVRRFELFY